MKIKYFPMVIILVIGILIGYGYSMYERFFYPHEASLKEIIEGQRVLNDIKTINDVDVTTIMSKAIYNPTWTLWKGENYGVLRFKDGTECKVRISVYGGFFAIEGIRGYYYFEDDERKIWDAKITVN